MKLTDILTPEAISPELQSKDKLGVLKELTELLGKSHPEINKDDVLRVLLEREKLGSTGTGSGVAIPHGKVDTLENLLICFGRSSKGIDFDSMDGKLAHLFFLLVAPADSVGTHLLALARISHLLNDAPARKMLLECRDSVEIFRLIQSFDEGKIAGA